MCILDSCHSASSSININFCKLATRNLPLKNKMKEKGFSLQKKEPNQILTGMAGTKSKNSCFFGFRSQNGSETNTEAVQTSSRFS